MSFVQPRQAHLQRYRPTGLRGGIVGHDQLSHRVVPLAREPCTLLIGQLNSFETARVRGRKVKECPRRRLSATDHVT